MIYNLLVYNKCCECTFYAEWNRVPSPPGKSVSKNPQSNRESTLSRPTPPAKSFVTTPSFLSSNSPSLNPFFPVGNVLSKDFSSSQSSQPSKLSDDHFESSNKNTNNPEVNKLSLFGSNSLQSLDYVDGSNSSIVDLWKLNLLNTTHPLIEHSKLVYGTVFSIRNFINKLKGLDSPFGGNVGNFTSYSTGNYKCNYFESPNGIKLVLFTDTKSESMQSVLQHIYSHIYVEYIVKSPLSSISPGSPQTFEGSEVFKVALNTYIQSLPSFSS
ncbi:Trafficking protein particle complex subunit 1 [Smittium mucronatum]|uniref:Trafficking protein particle complex subunit n=1 Tax=Smittium mucronatum TaxID=133383 RepID=A0A1R0GQN4_9FUNG|nr:Trafficking protein particle complex subunit 1 [Smittium mucronatum]